MADTASDLLRKCLAARRAGDDFPTVWQTVLKGHPLVVGVPFQRIENDQPLLEIRLITGQRLILDDKGYRIS